MKGKSAGFKGQAYPRDGKGGGQKRQGSFTNAFGAPDAKKPRNNSSTNMPPEQVMEVVGDLFPELSMVAVAVLQTVHEGGAQFLEGSVYAQRMNDQNPAGVGQLRTKIGKGWLRAFIACVDGVEVVQVEGRGEPCYCLKEQVHLVPLSAPPGASHGKEKKNSAGGGGGESNSFNSGLGGLMTECTSIGFGGGEFVSAPPPQINPRVGQISRAAAAARGPANLDQDTLQGILNALQLFLGHSPEGWLSGSALSKELVDSYPDLVTKAKEVYRYKQSKGWLRKVIDKDPSIVQVAVEGLGEPCWALASIAHTLKDLKAPPKEPKPERLQDRASLATLGGEESGEGDARPRKGQPLTPDEVLEKLGMEDFTNLCNVAVQCLQKCVAAGQEYIEGGKLSELIRAQANDLVDRSKTALGNKGWLKHVLQSEPRICRVEVQGRGEPCWSLTVKC